MKLLAIDLPSHGFNSKLSMINLSPMTYAEMINYSNESSKDPFTQLKVDIDLLRKDNPMIGELNYFDFESVLMMKKLISVTSIPTVKLEFRCSNTECRASNVLEVPIDEIHYSDFDADIAGNISSIKLGEKEVKVRLPKLKDIDKLLTLMQMSRSTHDFKVFQTLSILEFGDRPNDVVSAVTNATLDEILLLEYLRTSFIGGSKSVETTCKYCMRKESVAINLVATDMFRLLQLNEVVNKNKITLSKRVQS